MNIRNFSIKTLSTFFYLGYMPFIPGTAASIVGAFLYYLIKDSIFIYTSSTLLLILIGFLSAGEAERIFNKQDARCIVIDEISGILLSLIFIPYDMKLLIIAFCLFRILDAIKPYPADRLQRYKGSIGIMSDDILAGLYTNIILQLVLRGISFRIS